MSEAPQEKLGVKETKEALIGFNELSLYLIGKFKDGVQLSDVTAIVADIMAGHEIKEHITKALENVKAVPAEIKDLDLSEGLELGMYQAMQVPKILDALKK